MTYNLTPDDLRLAADVTRESESEGDADGRAEVRVDALMDFVRWVYAHPAAPASIHDEAARVLEWPSLAHGFSKKSETTN